MLRGPRPILVHLTSRPSGPFGDRLQAMKDLLTQKNYSPKPLTQALELPAVHKECENADAKK